MITNKKIIDKLIKTLNNFEGNINSIIDSYIKDNEDFIAELNSIGQLREKGIDSFGNSLGEYAPSTIAKKKDKGQITSHITLEDEGDFYRGFVVKPTSDAFTITSNDNKTFELTYRFGDAIFGLTDENKAELSIEIKNKLLQIFKNEYIKSA